MAEETREQKIALINMGYRRMGVNEDEGCVIYGKPFANILIRADVYQEKIVLIAIYSYRGESGVYSTKVIENGVVDDHHDVVAEMIEDIAFAESELRVDKVVECGSWPARFNFVTCAGRVAIESVLLARSTKYNRGW